MKYLVVEQHSKQKLNNHLGLIRRQITFQKWITKEKVFIVSHKTELIIIPLVYLVLIIALFSSLSISYLTASWIQLILSITVTLVYSKSFFNIQLFKRKNVVAIKSNNDED